VPITTKCASSNLIHDEVCSIQHYVIKFFSDLRQVGGFLRVLRFPSPIKLTERTDIAEILLKVALSTTTMLTETYYIVGSSKFYIIIVTVLFNIALLCLLLQYNYFQPSIEHLFPYQEFVKHSLLPI
jgi:hypothetical protein